MYLPFGMQAGNTNHIYKLAQQVGQRDAPPVGGFEVSFVSKFGGFVSRSLAAPPLTVTLGSMRPPFLAS